VSTLRVNNISDFSGGSSNLNIPGTAKAWVNFDGTGTVAIRANGNVSSITDNGVGDYTVNFTTAMPDANYSWSGSQRPGIVTNGWPFEVASGGGGARSSSSFRFRINTSSPAAIDPDICCISVFR
jgi:hypothetical protein